MVTVTIDPEFDLSVIKGDNGGFEVGGHKCKLNLHAEVDIAAASGLVKQAVGVINKMDVGGKLSKRLCPLLLKVANAAGGAPPLFEHAMNVLQSVPVFKPVIDAWMPKLNLENSAVMMSAPNPLNIKMEVEAFVPHFPQDFSSGTYKEGPAFPPLLRLHPRRQQNALVDVQASQQSDEVGEVGFDLQRRLDHLSQSLQLLTDNLKECEAEQCVTLRKLALETEIGMQG
jgi:hypothetical protein